MIPHVFGSVSGRNVEARFTFISTDERRSAQHVECEKVHADREYLDRQLCAVFAEAAMTPRSPRGRMCTRSGASIIQLVQTAFNVILRAWRAFGNERDLMGRVFRKGDDLLLTQFAGVYVETQADLSATNDKYVWTKEMPPIFGFLAVSALCRTALDMRTAINEAVLRLSAKSVFESAKPSVCPTVADIVISPCEAVQAMILHHGQCVDNVRDVEWIVRTVREKIRKNCKLRNAN